MRSEHPSMQPGRHSVRAEAMVLGRDCPVWCDGKHRINGSDAVCHGCTVVRHGDACVALSCVRYYDPAKAARTTIIVDLDADEGPTELAESDAIRLVGTLSAADDSPSWLAAALRSALELLDPGVGWAR